MDDNGMLANDGELFNAFTEPEEQETERRVNISKAQAAKPMIEDLIALFDTDIAQLKSIESIPVDITTNTEDFLKAWNVRQELLNYAENKKQYLETLLTTTRR